MGLVGLFAYLYRERRSQGVELDAHAPTLERDLLFFLAFFALAGRSPGGRRRRCGSRSASPSSSPTCFYVRRTLRGGGDVQGEETLDPLLFDRRVERRADPAARALRAAAPVGLGAMVGGAHLFVEELLGIADSLGVDALVLALILAPLATELPEKVNSFFWVREGKDSLALGNISGAMVFQSTIPVGIGLLFTDWSLSGNALLSIGLGLAGGLLAYVSLHRARRFKLPAGDRLVRALRGLHRGRGAERLSDARPRARRAP